MYQEISRIQPEVAPQLMQDAGIDVGRCEGHGACTGACPFAEAMVPRPHQMVRLVQLGQDEAALRANTQWICTDCLACTGACPSLVDVAGMMALLRRYSLQVDAIVPPDVEPIRKLHEAFVDELSGLGRINDVHWITSYKMRTLDLCDLTLAFTLFRKGRLRVFTRHRATGMKDLLRRVKRREDPE